MTLAIGDVAPNFTLPTDDGKTLALSELRGKKVILFFYPKDNTPHCTKEACDFRDHSATFAQKNTVILGISKDNEKSHTKFKEKYALSFPLLIDSDAKVCEAYGVMDKKILFGKLSLGLTRSTFLIDENGIIRGIWRNVKVSGHVEQILNEYH